MNAFYSPSSFGMLSWTANGSSSRSPGSMEGRSFVSNDLMTSTCHRFLLTSVPMTSSVCNNFGRGVQFSISPQHRRWRTNLIKSVSDRKFTIRAPSDVFNPFRTGHDDHPTMNQSNFECGSFVLHSVQCQLLRSSEVGQRHTLL